MSNKNIIIASIGLIALLAIAWFLYRKASDCKCSIVKLEESNSDLNSKMLYLYNNSKPAKEQEQKQTQAPYQEAVVSQEKQKRSEPTQQTDTRTKSQKYQDSISSFMK